MKRIHITQLLAFLTMILIMSCAKDELLSPSNTNTKITERANAQPVITFNPNPGVVNQPVTVNLEFGTCGQGQLQEEVPVGSGNWVPRVGNTPAGAGNPDITYNFTPTTVGTCAYKFRAVVTGGQNCTAYTGAQPGVCLNVVSSGCTDTLTAVAGCSTTECNRSVTYTYIAGGDYDHIVIQGGLTAFTTICTATGTGGLTQNTTHPGVIHSNANVTRWEADGVEECDVYTVTITWHSDNANAVITGDWSVVDGNGNELATIPGLTCPQ
jgi:hypothetical protein